MLKVELGRISGQIPDIETIRPVIHFCRIFSLTEVIRPDIRQFSLLYQTKLTFFGHLSGQTGYPAQP